MVTDWIAIHEATWPTWNPLLMRLDTGVPDLHCGIAARAISRAMGVLRSIVWLFVTRVGALVVEGGKSMNL